VWLEKHKLYQILKGLIGTAAFCVQNYDIAKGKN